MLSRCCLWRMGTGEPHSTRREGARQLPELQQNSSNCELLDPAKTKRCKSGQLVAVESELQRDTLHPKKTVLHYCASGAHDDLRCSCTGKAATTTTAPGRKPPPTKKSRIVPAATLHTSNGAKLLASLRGVRVKRPSQQPATHRQQRHTPNNSNNNSSPTHEAPFTSCDFRLFPRTV